MKKFVAIILFVLLFSGQTIAVNRFTALNSEIKAAVSRNHGAKLLPGHRVAVSFIDIKSGYKISVNGDKIFPAASIIKIPVLAALFDQIQKKRISLKERIYCSNRDKLPEAGQLQWLPPQFYSVQNLAFRMIANSDNTATRLLVRRVGRARVNAYAKKNGLRNTFVRDETALSELPNSNVNLTSANDIAKVLLRIETGKGFSPSSRKEMLSYMFSQKYVFGIPKALPPGFRCANKTGMLSNVLHDSAIVYSLRGNYILCVFTKGFVNEKKAASLIREISRIVSSYYI